MDEKMKEMICIGASVAAHCQPCLAYHAKKGREAGLSPEEIKQCVEIGEMVGKGAQNAIRKFANEVLNHEDK